METFSETILEYYQTVTSYPLYYFGFFGLVLAVALFFYIHNKYNKENKIKIINSLLKKKPEKALEKISASDLETINYFLTPEEVNSGHFVKIKDHFSNPQELKNIYNKILSKKKKQKYYKQMGINIFSQLKTPQSAEYLITFLYEDDMDLITDTINALTEFDYDKIIFSFLELLETKPNSEIMENMKDIFTSSSKNAEKLLKFAENANTKVISWCIDIFANFKEDKFYQAIRQFLDSDSPQIKIKAIKQLENFTDKHKKEIFHKLRENLKEDNENIRAQALKTLSSIDSKENIKYIANRLNDDSPLVRKAATDTLLDMGNRGLKYLLDTAKQPKAPKEVIKALEKQGIPFIIEAVERLYVNNSNTKNKDNKKNIS